MVEELTNTNNKIDFSNLINPYTNKPVQTGSSVSFNQKIYNDKNYMQSKNDLLNNLNNSMTRPQTVNQQALYDIPVVPEFMQQEYNEAYSVGNWLNSLNIATEAEIEEWRAKGKMGIGETAQRLKSLKSAKYVPFVGTTAEVGYNLDMLSAVNRLKKGKQISDVEKDLLVDYLRELKEIQVRGTTLPSKALNAILESIPFAIEFGAGVAAAPETFGSSLSVSGLALSKAAGKKAARKAVEKAIKSAATESVMTGTKKNVSLSAAKSLYKSTYNEMLKAGSTKAVKEVGGKEAAKIIAKTTPQSIAAANFGSKPLTYMTLKNTLGGIADRQLAGSMQVTDAGEVVFLEPENMALSIMKSFGSAIFDNYTETMGWAFAPVTSYFAKPIRSILPPKFFKEFEKLVTSRYGIPAAQALKKYGYDGVVEEMGEELLNRFLCQTFGINGLDEYTFDGFMNNVFYANDPEQWLVEALSFAAMGAGAHGIHGAASKIREQLEKQGNEKAAQRLADLVNKKIYSPAEYYLEQGLIKINGSQSEAERVLREKFEENGIDKNSADEFFRTASELQIRDKLKEFYDSEEQDADKRREKAINFLADKMLADRTKYKNEEDAKRNANIFVTALEKFSELEKIPIETLIEKEAPTIRNIDEIGYVQNSPEASQEENQQRNIDARLSELEQEFNAISSGEDFDAEKFNELEAEYNELMELKNQTSSNYDFNANLINNFGMSAQELTDIVKGDINNILQENDINTEEFNIEDIKVFGSYTTGKNKNSSDLDFIVQYNGSMREDDAFNMLHGDTMSISDVNGKEVNIDINPINSATSGTIADRNDVYYQIDNSEIGNKIAKTIDKIKTIIKSKKISELSNEFEFFNLFSDELKNVQDYYIDNLPKSFKSGNTRGTHVGSAKTVYINFEAIGDNFIQFIQTLAHEAEHAKQEKEYKKIQNKKRKTKNDWDIIRNYNFCQEANENRQKFYRKNKKILSRIFEDIHGLNQSQKNEYLTNLSKNDYNTYIEYAKLYDKYYNTNNEVVAREAGKNAERKAKSFNSRDFEIAQSSYGRFRKRYVGAGFRNSLKETQNARYQKGNGRNNLRYHQFAGEKSETADKHSLLNARKMLVNGDNAEYVRKLTGWFKGVDGNWKYEISDSDAIVNAENIKKARQDEIDHVNLNIKDYNARMSDLVQRHDAKEIDDKDFREQYDHLMNRKLEEVDALNYYERKGYSAFLPKILDHEKLYAAYPSLRSVRVEFKPLPHGVMGRYSHSANEIILDLTLLSDNKELKKTLMHEIQHFIQHKEGFATGGNAENIEIILSDAKNAIENGRDAKHYDFVMKRYSIVNNVLLIRSLQNRPENVTKSYWWLEKGKGWYAPRKTRKKDRAKYISECCQEFIDYSIQKHTDNNTLEAYNNYSKKDTAELKKIARKLNYEAGKILDKIDYKTVGKIDTALRQLNNYEVNTFELYKRLAGETEARNTAKRANLTEEERKKYSPNDYTNVLYGVDVKPENQIVVFDDGTEAFSESDISGDYQEGSIYEQLKKIKGNYVPAENLIELFKNADESTIVHEFAHWWLDRLVKYSADNEELAADVAEIRKFLKNDGGEFTREQHEKFARGFEAYIRSGYARTNRLKRIFEDFKNALLAIYDALTKIVYTENGIEKSFKDEDIPQIQNLFDRLLTTERERIKSTVFDKVAEVEAKINEIKENEKNELQELDNIYKENISALNRQSDKKRSVQEYLDLADKMTSRETKEVKEFKERYKNVTLDILATATGMSKKAIANPRNWDKVKAAFELSDNISVMGGMMPEWQEFYGDTGVNYDTEETGGNYKLAEQAFQVLTEGSYNKTFDENYEFEDINKFSAKVDYLAAKVKTLKGDERNSAVEAMFSLFNNMPSMPDEVTHSLVEKAVEVAEDADINSREDYNSRVITSIPVIHQLQFIITQKLNDLKVYNPETRYKMRLSRSHRLYRYIKDINSVNSAKKQIRRINEFIIDDMRNNQRMLLHKEIQKQLKVNSKLIKVGTISKGKFDWRTNTIFAELVELNKLSREEAENQFAMLVQIQDAAKGEDRESSTENETGEFVKTNDFQRILKNKFLQYRSMKLQDLDVEHTIQLLQDILELKEKGREAKSEEDFINKTLKWNTKNNLLDILEITKSSGAKYGANWVAGVGKFTSLNGGTLANWESLLNSIFNKDTAQKYSLLLDEANSDIYARKHILNFYKRATEIYGFRTPNNWDRFLDYDNMQPIIKLFQDYDKEKYTFTQKVFSINSPDGFARSSIEISRAQMITMFAWSLNEKLEQRLANQFGGQLREMFFEILSDEDKELAWALIDTCEEMREDINEVFIRTTGLSLPKVENYFPSKAERVQSDLDLYHDNWVKSSSPSFIKQRKVCNRIPMKPHAPLEILIPHINKTAKYVVMSEKVNFLNQIFKDTAIKTKMQEIWGSKNGADIYQTLINKLSACTFTNYAKGTNLVAGALDLLSRNYITSSIGFSPKVALGQLLSVINYAENMPMGVWAKGFTETIAHPVESFKYMLDNCEYLQARLAGNSQNEVIAILTSEKDKFRTLRNFMTSNVKWGDIIAITLGGKPYVDYLMQQGMSKEDAFNQFVENTLRAQQAGTTSSISEWQSAQARNCLSRMVFAFRNTDMQYERKFIDTLIQDKKGEISKKDFIKKLFIYKIFNPFMFTAFLQNMALVAFFRGIFAGDDPEDYIGGILKNTFEAVLLGGLNAYGFAGFISSTVMESLIAAFDKEFKHFEKTVPILSDFDYQVQKYLKGDLSFADYVDAVAQGSEYALGIPATKVVNTLEGAGDVAKGNIGVGLSRMAGWGNYTATKAWTGKKPEKKRKRKN